MQLRTAHDLGPAVQEARKGLGWSQGQLAEVVGVSRQWVSLVENGKTSVEFDLVLSLLQALGYNVSLGTVEGQGIAAHEGRGPDRVRSHDPSIPTALTKGGRPLGHQRSRRQRGYQDDE
jgi:y4mF family transcriptional regulator